MSVAALCGCTAQQAQAASTPECQAHQFQACDAGCGRGARFCDENTLTWSECSCVVLDASFDAPAEASADATPDAD